jgi:hypothetical protein
MTSPVIVRGTIALCSLIFLFLTVITATEPSGDYLVVAALCGMFSLGLAVIASAGGVPQS